MNLTTFEKVRDRIADKRNRFFMGDWDSCIAGHACAVGGKTIEWLKTADPDDIRAEAERLLGLSEKQTNKLFFLVEWPIKYFEICYYGGPDCANNERKAALALLDSLIEESRKRRKRVPKPTANDMAAVRDLVESATEERLVKA